MPLLSFPLRELDGYGWVVLECFDGNEEQPPQSEEFWGTLAEISAFRSSHHCCVFFQFFLHQGDHCNLPVQCGWRRDRSCLQIYITGLIKEMGRWGNGATAFGVQPLLAELLTAFTHFTRTLFGSLP